MAGQACTQRGLSPPPYEKIKRYVVERIADGTWKPGDTIPSETVFAKTFGVARMTVNRALRELSAERILTRVQGAGTFVTPRDHESPVLEIRNIADEVALRGHCYSARVLVLDASSNSRAMATLGVNNDPVFHSCIVHYEDESAIQYEDRYVNPKVFPQYLDQDFTAETPNHYMVRLAPIQRAEFRIYARKPSAQIRRYLSIDIGEPCLLIWRRTWVGDVIATTVHLWHSASRVHLSGKV
ncbi:UTRA domain-containing protein [Paraburkholderia tagetis]|uniref:UTRA domain-containing protein n=1 Tax=Paraburkholderia tagetis TaxID=2913261 RepID=A0A9X1UE14_9BURK|nr:UTRA domain-containing protein [Paraburkholderia tagetis]MCG5073179.1 UTRA domain-containing protein [Paraburkholderia tagetis]